MERSKINKKDMEGKEVRVGDAFEYGDCVYIVSLDKNNRPYMRVFENQVQYDVEMEPEYLEVSPEEVEDMQFEFAKIIGSIEDNEQIKELYNREIDIHEQQEDEYDYDFADNFDEEELEDIFNNNDEE